MQMRTPERKEPDTTAGLILIGLLMQYTFKVVILLWLVRGVFPYVSEWLHIIKGA